MRIGKEQRHYCAWTLVRFFLATIALTVSSCGFLSTHSQPSVTTISSPNLGPPPRVQRLPQRPGCGFVQVGADRIPIDCATPGYSEISSASRPILPDAVFKAGTVGAAELPAVIDHRADGTEGPVRNQGHVGACSALSFANGNRSCPCAT